jgi:hypothetical protein
MSRYSILVVNRNQKQSHNKMSKSIRDYDDRLLQACAIYAKLSFREVSLSSPNHHHYQSSEW